jgi:hypothetical protein
MKTLLFASVVALVPSLTPVSVPAQSSDETAISLMSSDRQGLDGFLAEALPDWVIVTDIRTREFANGSAGRMSVAGTLTTLQDLVAPVDGFSGLRNALVSDYAVLGHIDAAVALTVGTSERNSQPKYREFIVSIPEGTEIAFNAELPYLETVDGRRYSGQVDFSLPQSLPGQIAVQDMQANGYVVDGLRFDDVYFEAGVNLGEMDFSVTKTMMDTFHDGLFRYGLPMVTVSYDRPLVDFTFAGNPMTDLASRILYQPPDGWGVVPARLVVDFPLLAKAYEGAEQKYKTLADDMSIQWYLRLTMPVAERIPQSVSVQVMYRSASGQQQLTQPMQWNGQYFENSRSQFYPHEQYDFAHLSAGEIEG